MKKTHKAIDSVYGLSPLQEGILFHTLERSGEDKYIVQVSCRIPGLHHDRWRAAWSRVIRRHDVLRTAFAWQKVAKPVQVVVAEASPDWEELSWPATDAGNCARELRSFLRDDRRRGINIAKAPLMRMTTVWLGNGECLFIWTYHHLILDAWSASIVMSGVLAAYAGDDEHALLTPPRFAAYLQHRATRSRRRAEHFWESHFKELGRPPRLLLSAPEGARGEGEMCSCSRESSLEVAQAITAFTRRMRCTLAHVVQAAWALILHRYCDSDEVVFGWVVSDRPADIAGIEGMVGLMVDTVPVRIRVSRTGTPQALINQIARVCMDVGEHSHLPLPEIQRLAGIAGGESLFETIVVIENLPAQLAPHKQSALAVSDRCAHWRTTYSLSLMAAFEERLKLQIAYDDHQHRPVAVNRLLDELHRLIEAVVAEPEASLDSIMDRAGLSCMGSYRSGPVTPLSDMPISADILARAGSMPDALALEALAAPGSALTGAALVESVRELTHTLKTRGIRRGDVVALEMRRSVGLVVAMLAVMESGAAFLPVDPALPALRKDFMIENSAACLRITDTEIIPIVASGSPPALLHGAAPVAYILYTSGSSGRPKGVAVGQRSLRALLESMAREPGLSQLDVLLATTTISFDISLLELLLPLLQGARLVLSPEGLLRDAESVAAALEQYGVTVMQATPTTWRMLAGAGWRGKANLRVWSGGEYLDRELAEWLVQCTEAVWNLYGPTETTIWSMRARVLPGQQTMDLGEPIENTYIRLLDGHGRHAARGIPAEIFIGGAGVAAGYVVEEGQSAFQSDPFHPDSSQRLYRTGDLARLDEQGRFCYVGRKDAQVKFRGMRLELAEIEGLLTEHPGVSQAAVKVCSIGGIDELVAYVVVNETVADADLLALLAARLPHGQVPARLVRLDLLPTTFNGKLDRAALPVPESRDLVSRGGETTSSVIEQVVAQIWATALSVPALRPCDNFFSEGGHSLKVIAAIAGINRAFSVAVPLSLLFQNPTPTQFARALERVLAGEAHGPAVIPGRTKRGVPQPLSSGQQRLWYVTRMDPGERPYLLAAAVKLTGRLDVPLLCRAFGSLQRRHCILRTVFREEGGRASQIVQADASLNFEVLDPAIDEAASGEWVRAEIARQVAKDLPLSGGVPARASLIRRSPTEHVLLLMIHHMLVDEWALGLLIQDLGRCYEALSCGSELTADEVALDFIDFAVAEQLKWEQHGYAREIAYWRQKLADLPLTTLPARRARPNVLVFRGANHTACISAELYSSIVRLAKSRAVTPFVVLLTGFLALLHRYLARTDLCVGMMDAGRDDPAIENIVGPFARPLALRVDLGEETSFESHLQTVQKTLIEGWLHRDAPFEHIVSSVSASRRTHVNPLFQIMLVMQNLRGAPPDFAGIQVEPLAVDTAIAEFDLMVEMFETQGGLTLRFSYNSNLYSATEISLFARRYESLLWVVSDDPAVPVSGIDVLQRDEAV
jgi:amino acid adenylation domain-containing protein